MTQTMERKREESSVLDFLLGDAPDITQDLPEARYRVDRLSEQAGRDITFRLRALPYGRVQDLSRMTQEAEVAILLAGCVEPDLKDPRLLERFRAPTPAEAVKKLLLPGEIADLSRAVEQLTGYRRTTITEIKNASGTAGTGN